MNTTNKTKKTYTIIDFPIKGQQYGKFESTSPNMAASKALTVLSKLKNISNKNNNYVIFTITEENKSANSKAYTYIGTRIVLDNLLNNKIKYKNVISRYKKI